MVPEITTQPDSTHVEGATLQIWTPDPRVVVTRIEGRFALTHALKVMQAVDNAVLRHPGQAIGMHDWTGVEAYDIAVQARMGPWSAKVIRSMERVVVAVSSPLVALAVRSVNLAVGGRFELLDTRPEFEGAVSRTLTQLRAL